MPRFVWQFLALATVLSGLFPIGAEIRPFSFRPEQAEYSLGLERIIFTSAEPDRLHLYDPASDSDVTVALGAAPVAMALSADGRFAAVGHARSISYVDLSARTVVRTFATSQTVRSVAMSGTHVFYVTAEVSGGSFPREGGSEMLGNFRLRSPKIAPGGAALIGISYPGTALVRRAVSGGQIALDERQVETSGFPADCGGLWLPEGSGRIYSRCGTVFGAWDEGAAYPPHVTGLPAAIDGVAERQGQPLVAVLHAAPNPSQGARAVAIYERTYLHPLGEIPLTPAEGPDGTVPVRGRWVFSAPTPGQFFVVTESSASAGEPGRFWIETIDTAADSPCAATVENSSVEIGGHADRYSSAAALPPHCQALPLSDADWLQITSGRWLRGEGSVAWRARANLTGAARVGRITIGDKAVTVTQAALTGLPGVNPVGGRILDATYSAALDRLLWISEEPSELGIYNPTTGALQPVALPSAPKRLTLTGGGTVAVVGHDGWASYIDLHSGTVARTVETQTDCGAIASMPDGYTYLLPINDRGVITRLRDLDGARSRWTITNGSNAYSFAAESYLTAEPGPDGRSLFAAGNNVLQRLELTGEGVTLRALSGVACSPAWVTEDARKAVTQCNTNYRLDSDGATADRFSYPDTAVIAGIDYSPQAHATAIVSRGGGDPAEAYLQVFGDEGFPRLLRMAMPAMTDRTGTQNTSGEYVFWAANPARLVVVAESRPAPFADGPMGVTVLNLSTPAAECPVALTPETATAPFGPAMGSIALETDAGCVWEAVSSEPWLRLTGGAAGMGSASLTYTVAANPAFSPRSATITVRGQTVTVTQSAGPVLLSPVTAAVTAAGVTAATLHVTTSADDVSWAAAANQSWITIEGPSSGTGAGSVTYSVAANPGPGTRVGSIGVNGAVLTITQSGTFAAPIAEHPTGSGTEWTLHWRTAVGEHPSGYRLMIAARREDLPAQIGAVECGACIVNTAVTGNSYRIEAGLLRADTTYFWQVSARDGEQAGAWSAILLLPTGKTSMLPVAVFRLGSGELAANRRGEKSWRRSGGALAGDPAVARDSETGTMWVAARDQYNGLWLNSLTAEGEWGDWKPLGGVVEGTPAAAISRDGVLNVAIRDQYGAFWMVRHTITTATTEWLYLGGVFSGDPAVAASPDGSVRVVGRDSWGGLWSLRRAADGTVSGWSFGGGITVGAVSAAVASDGSTYVAARDAGRMVWVARVSADNVWGLWEPTGGLSEQAPQLLAPETGARMALVIADATGASWVRWFVVGPSAWEPWEARGGIVTSMAAVYANGELALAGFDPAENLWWYTGGSWELAAPADPGHGNAVAPR